MHSIEFSKKAEFQFDKLPLSLQGRIIAVLERMKIRPFHFVKRIVGSPYYRARAGEYRIILDIVKNKMLIYVIEPGHRRNIYKK
jgi:mRNA interferase RelE/StbE